MLRCRHSSHEEKSKKNTSKTLISIVLSCTLILCVMLSVPVFAATNRFSGNPFGQEEANRLSFREWISLFDLWRGARTSDDQNNTDIDPASAPAEPTGARFDVRNLTYQIIPTRKFVYDVSYIDDGELKPVIIAVHGGSWNGGSNKDMASVVGTFVPQGYVVVRVDYGKVSEGQFIDDQIDQVLEAVKTVSVNASRWQGDKDRMVMLGYSAGAQLAARVAQIVCSSPSSYDFKIKALVDYSGPCDLSVMEINPRWVVVVDGTMGTVAEKIAKINPAEFVSPRQCPTLILHGVKDKSVPIASSESFYRKLISSGVTAEFYQVNGLEHELEMIYCASITEKFLARHV